MENYIPLIILIYIATASSFCAYKSVTSDRLRTISKLTGNNSIQTVLTTSLRQNEKVCAELIFQNEDGTQVNITKQSDRRFLNIELLNVVQEYQIKSDYNFTIPSIDVKCICDCPGGSDLCNVNFETDSNCDSSQKHLSSVNCFKKYFFGHSSGCFAYPDPAEVCCTIAMYRDKTSVVYRALYIDSPITRYQYKIALLDNSDNELALTKICTTSTIHGTLDFKFSGEKELKITSGEKNVRLEVNGQAVTKLVPSMWLYLNPVTGKLMVSQSLGLNLVDETSLHKLGWFKVGNKQNPIVHPNIARMALNVNVLNCKNDKFRDDWDFSAVGWRKKGKNASVSAEEGGVWMNEFYSSIVADVSFTKFGRSIEIKPSKTVAVPVTLNLDFNVKLLVRYDESRFERFSGHILLDEYSNFLLNLNIEKAFGSILVQIGNNKSCILQQETIHVNSIKLITVTRSIQLKSCLTGMQLVCLHTLPRRKIFHCKEIKFEQKFFRGPNTKRPPGKSDVGILTDQKTSNWMDKIWSFCEDFKNEVYAIVFSFVGVILFVAIGVVICWKKRFCCLFTKSDKVDGEKEKNYLI